MASGNTGSAALGSTAGLHTAPFLDEIQKVWSWAPPTAWVVQSHASPTRRVSLPRGARECRPLLAHHESDILLTTHYARAILQEHRLRPSLTRDTASHLPSAEDIRAEKAEIGGSDIPTSAIDPKLKSGRAGAIAGSSK
jgi:hypothetical protein